MPDKPWQPSRATTIVIGLLSLWPILYMGIFFGVLAFTFVRFASASAAHPAEAPVFFLALFPLHFLTILLQFALIAIYVIHAFRTDRIENDKRVLWVVVLFLGNMLAFPIYWYLYLWRETCSRCRRSRRPATRSARGWTKACVPQAGINADCHYDAFSCWYSPGICFTSGSTQPDLLSSKWKIASIEIERRVPAEPLANETRVAVKAEKKELPKLQ